MIQVQRTPVAGRRERDRRSEDRGAAVHGLWGCVGKGLTGAKVLSGDASSLHREAVEL